MLRIICSFSAVGYCVSVFLMYFDEWFGYPCLFFMITAFVSGLILTYEPEQTVVITHTQVMSLSNLGLAKEKKPKTGLTVADIHADYLEDSGCPKEWTDKLRKFDQCYDCR